MEEKISLLIKKSLEDKQIIVKKIEYVKENNIYFLRIYIDKHPFVDIDACVEASEIINPLVDKVKEIDRSYVLDICSYSEGDN